MVCIYCGAPTRVTNSRHQKRQNTVWRRRHCVSCGSTVTTEESARYDSALVLRRTDGSLEPFSRDKLLISLYKSLAHRKTATGDASALCSTVIAILRQQTDSGPTIDLLTLTEAARICLQRFDTAAGSHYQAYHHPNS